MGKYRWDLAEIVAKEATKYKEKRDCAVRTAVFLTGYPYPYMHGLFARRGRKWRGSTPFKMMYDVLKEVGYERRDCKKNGDKWSDVYRTIMSLERYGPRRGRFLLITRRHMSAFINGKLHCSAKDHGKKRYIKEMYQMVVDKKRTERTRIAITKMFREKRKEYMERQETLESMDYRHKVPLKKVVKYAIESRFIEGQYDSLANWIMEN